MNKMKEVAQLLGVELGQEFNIKTLEEKYRLTSNGLEMYNHLTSKWDETAGRFFQQLLAGKLEIKKPILEKVEKEYLENVIRPFRDKRIMVVKLNSVLEEEKKEFIAICFDGDEDIYFPRFKKGQMYNGMQVNEYYTLKELGLFEDD